ncbi:MAG: biotin/lipoyl-binding protein [Luteitalea sp.]|nr:biotin/lipoyl-binding protein [Luteitalea sp.]
MTDPKDELAALRIEREPMRPARGRSMTWIVAVLLLGAAGGALWLWLTRERPIEVEVAAVTERAAGTQASVLNASGYVTARRRATVSSKVTGKVVEVNVEEGMAVREGQTAIPASTRRSSFSGTITWTRTAGRARGWSAGTSSRSKTPRRLRR